MSKPAVPGRMMMITPTKPMAMAIQRRQPTRSPRKIAAAALDCYLRALALDPRSARAHLNAGNARRLLRENYTMHTHMLRCNIFNGVITGYFESNKFVT